MSIDSKDLLSKIYRKEKDVRAAFIAVPPIKGICKFRNYDFTISSRPVSEWVPEILENYRMMVEYHEEIGDDAVPYAKIMTGTHIYAAAFGCQVYRFDNDNPCALPMVSYAAEADRLKKPDIWKSPVLYRIFELAELVRNELGPDIPLGPPDMQTGFDTAALIWEKSDFLCSLVMDETKDSAHGLIAKCTSLLKEFLRELHARFPNMSPCHCPTAWSPYLGPWLSNDECGAIGNEQFNEFALPELVDLSGTFGGLAMHCCADAEHQFELFKRIPNFYAFNRVAARKGWLPAVETLGGPNGPAFVLQWISDEDIVKLLENSPTGTRFIFCRDVKSIEEGKKWIGSMRSLQKTSSG